MFSLKFLGECLVETQNHSEQNYIDLSLFRYCVG